MPALLPKRVQRQRSVSDYAAKYTTDPHNTLSLSVDSDILTITLQRPKKKNAMNFLMIRELLALSEVIKNDRTLRAVIITGAEDTFCAGIDLSDLNNSKNRAFAVWELVKPWQSLFQKVCLVWQDMPIPVIAAIQGHCIGAGLQFALGCDIRIASSNAKLAIMEAKWGLVPDMGLAQSSLGVIPVDVLKELAMTAKVVNADEALQLGLITHVDDAPYEHARKLCLDIINRSPDAVLACKRMIDMRYGTSPITLYFEKVWQLKLMLGRNRSKAIKKVKDASIHYAKRQFK